MKDKIKVYDFDQLYLAYKGVYLYVYIDDLYRKIKYRLEDMNTENSAKYHYCKNVVNDCTIEYYLNYIKEEYGYDA